MKTIAALSGVVIKELYRRKDFYVLFIITILICLVMASVNVFNDDKVVRYLKDISLLLIWLASLVIAITTTARQIPAEREQRTLLPLLAKPITRTELVFGKFFGCWFACGITLLCFYIFFAALAASREHTVPVLGYFQAAALHWTILGVVVAISLLGSLVFAAPSSNATIIFVFVAGILTIGRHLHQVALAQPEPTQSIIYAIYLIIPHLEIFDVRDLIVHNWPLIPWGYFALAILYALAYTAAFLIAACLVFRRKAVN